MAAFASLQDTDFSALDRKLEAFGLQGGDFEVNSTRNGEDRC